MATRRYKWQRRQANKCYVRIRTKSPSFEVVGSNSDAVQTLVPQIKIAQQPSQIGTQLNETATIDTTRQKVFTNRIGRGDLPRLRECGTMRNLKRTALRTAKENKAAHQRSARSHAQGLRPHALLAVSILQTSVCGKRNFFVILELLLAAQATLGKSPDPQPIIAKKPINHFHLVKTFTSPTNWRRAQNACEDDNIAKQTPVAPFIKSTL